MYKHNRQVLNEFKDFCITIALDTCSCLVISMLTLVIFINLSIQFSLNIIKNYIDLTSHFCLLISTLTLVILLGL